MSGGDHGVMVSTVDAAGHVTTRLWLVSAAAAAWVAGQLGAPVMEQVQTPQQSRAGARAGAGTVLYHDGRDGGPRS